MDPIRTTFVALVAALLLASCAAGAARVSVGPADLVADGDRHFIGLAIAP